MERHDTSDVILRVWEQALESTILALEPLSGKRVLSLPEPCRSLEEAEQFARLAAGLTEDDARDSVRWSVHPWPLVAITNDPSRSLDDRVLAWCGLVHSRPNAIRLFDRDWDRAQHELAVSAVDLGVSRERAYQHALAAAGARVILESPDTIGHELFRLIRLQVKHDLDADSPMRHYGYSEQTFSVRDKRNASRAGDAGVPTIDTIEYRHTIEYDLLLEQIDSLLASRNQATRDATVWWNMLLQTHLSETDRMALSLKAAAAAPLNAAERKRVQRAKKRLLEVYESALIEHPELSQIDVTSLLGFTLIDRGRKNDPELVEILNCYLDGIDSVSLNSTKYCDWISL